MKKNKILLVDDEEIVLAGWQEVLESSGYDVRTALSGKEALEIVNKEKPDIVFTDLVMPDMNGIEVCKRIKEIYPDLDVVFVSGHPLEIEKYLMDFLNAGGRDEYLRKPLYKEEILKITKQILMQKK